MTDSSVVITIWGENEETQDVVLNLSYHEEKKFDGLAVVKRAIIDEASIPSKIVIEPTSLEEDIVNNLMLSDPEKRIWSLQCKVQCEITSEYQYADR